MYLKVNRQNCNIYYLLKCILLPNTNLFFFYYLLQKGLGERLLIMIAAAFLHCMIMKQLPSSTQERHTNQNMCLCQFVEIVLSEYFQCLSKQNIIHDLQDILQKRLYLSITKKTLKERQQSLAIKEDFSFVSV